MPLIFWNLWVNPVDFGCSCHYSGKNREVSLGLVFASPPSLSLLRFIVENASLHTSGENSTSTHSYSGFCLDPSPTTPLPACTHNILQLFQNQFYIAHFFICKYFRIFL